ncbi:hypothetical protein GCM10027060_20140 [Nesterenkonia halophila]
MQDRKEDADQRVISSRALGFRLVAAWTGATISVASVRQANTQRKPVPYSSWSGWSTSQFNWCAASAGAIIGATARGMV